MRKSRSPLSPSLQVEALRSLQGPLAGCFYLVVPLTDDLTVHDLLLVPSANQASILEQRHHLVKCRSTLSNAGVAQPLAQIAATPRSVRELRESEKLQMGETR
jgi:hypothetical protein